MKTQLLTIIVSAVILFFACPVRATVWTSGHYEINDGDGYLGDERELFYVTENGRCFEIIERWWAEGFFKKRLPEIPEIKFIPRTTSDLSYILNKVKDPGIKREIKKKYLKEA